MQLNLTAVEYTYPGAAEPALRGISATFARGWTGIIGDNGCGKTTLARLAAGELAPDAGTVGPRLFAVYCEQDASVPPATLVDFAVDWSSDAQRLRRNLDIEDDWLWRYGTLSGGQRKRVQIGCALWVRPDVLVMDEPTNDLDGASRAVVADALAGFGGIGLLISHDRVLLDRLAARCLVFEGGRAVMRPGGYTKVMGQARAERQAALDAHDNARKEAKRLETEAARRREEASRAAGKRSARGLDKHDSDGRERLGRAIVSGKDGVAGKLSATMERRLDRANEAAAALQVGKRYEHGFGDYGSVAQAKALAHLEAGVLEAGDFRLRVPELWLGPTDRIVLSGDNGCGKSLLVRRLRELVRPDLPLAYLPQEVDGAQRDRALAALRELDPKRAGQVLALAGRLNSDPDRLLDGRDVSPGELRKLMLAQQLVEEPCLLILDEPTNHLDVGSAEALEALLTTFPGAYLLVTHDAALMEAAGEARWHVERIGESECALRIC